MTGMDLQFEVEEVEAFVKQPDGSVFSWYERFQCYCHLIYGIVSFFCGHLSFLQVEIPLCNLLCLLASSTHAACCFTRFSDYRCLSFLVQENIRKKHSCDDENEKCGMLINFVAVISSVAMTTMELQSCMNSPIDNLTCLNIFVLL